MKEFCGTNYLFIFVSILSQDTWWAVGLKMNYVMDSVTNSVRFNHASALSLLELLALLEEAESECCEMIYDTNVRWLRHDIKLSMAKRGRIIE
jgi:hypothetical protein